MSVIPLRGEEHLELHKPYAKICDLTRQLLEAVTDLQVLERIDPVKEWGNKFHLDDQFSQYLAELNSKRAAVPALLVDLFDRIKFDCNVKELAYRFNEKLVSRPLERLEDTVAYLTKMVALERKVDWTEAKSQIDFNLSFLEVGLARIEAVPLVNERIVHEAANRLRKMTVREVEIPLSKPEWNDDTSTIRLGNQSAKVRPTAKNLVPILRVFEEEGWPARIDDPLPKGPNGERLRNSIKQLNKTVGFIRFTADGKGEGILWTVEPET